MKKLRNTFVEPKNPFDEWFDLFDDWNMIEASFAAEYHIRLRTEENMSWGEFASLLRGLSADSPLGRLISIRRENDKTALKNFTSEQHKIRSEWRMRQQQKAQSDIDLTNDRLEDFKMFCKTMFQNKN